MPTLGWIEKDKVINLYLDVSINKEDILDY